MKTSHALSSILLPYLGIEDAPHSLIVTVNIQTMNVHVLCDSFEFETSVTCLAWHNKLIEFNVIERDTSYIGYTLVLVAGEPAKILTSQFVK